MVVALVSVPVVQLVGDLREARRATPAQTRDTAASTQALDGSDGQGGSWLRSLARVNRRLTSDIGAYEEDLEEQSVVARFFRPPTQRVLTGMLGAGNEKVYCGREGWLFYRQSIDYVTGPGFLTARLRERRANEPARPDPVEAIVGFHRQLESRGIQLVVLPVPVKTTTHPEKFTSRINRGDGPVQNASYGEFLDRLREQGVRVFAMDSMLAEQKAPQELYLRQDTHWRPEVVEQAARELASFLRDLGPLSAAGETLFTHATALVRNTGDLAAMLQLPATQRGFPAQEVPIRPVMTVTGEPWSPDRTASVLLLGDSYANIYSMEALGWGAGAGLGPQLSFALQQPVDCILRNDSGAFATRQMLRDELARGNDRLMGKRVVVYQFSERELMFGDWRLIELPSAQEAVETFFCPAPGSTVEATGIVSALSHVPRPFSVPYRDHIFAVGLSDIHAVGGSESMGRAVAYLWSMRSNELTRAARLRPGHVVSVRLRPWADVADSLDAINRSELDQLAADPCWAELLE